MNTHHPRSEKLIQKYLEQQRPRTAAAEANDALEAKFQAWIASGREFPRNPPLAAPIYRPRSPLAIAFAAQQRRALQRKARLVHWFARLISRL